MAWPPSQHPNDCFQGFCSIDCPQWCYFLLASPPPPFHVTTSGGSGSEFSPRTVSPIVIAIIAVTAAILLLLGYYITYKYWQQLHRPRWGPSFDGAEVGTGWWHASLPIGLDQSLINKITICSYRKGDGLVGAPNCSVCLSEFREDESLRLLPNCGHAFHAQCIDTWLKFHPNCPLCRAGIVSAAPPVGLPAPHESEGDRGVEVSDRANEVALALQDSETSIPGNNGEAPKGPLESLCDVGGVQERYHVIDFRDDRIQPVRRSLSIGSSCRGLDSIANDDYEGRAKSGEGSPVFEGMAASSTGCRGEEH